MEKAIKEKSVSRLNSNPNVMTCRKSAWTGIISNVLENYDFTVYGYLSSILAVVFFAPAAETETNPSSEGNQSLVLVNTFLVFAIGYIMKPIGGYVLGQIGDRHGPVFALERSILIMGVMTYLIGCLPTYAMVGDTAWVLLVFFRLIQGFSMGGQLMIAAVYTLENQPKNKWGSFSSHIGVSGGVGSLLASYVCSGLRSRLSPQDMLEWGWRLPFYAGILTGLIAMYLRHYYINQPIIIHHDHHDTTTTNNNSQHSNNTITPINITVLPDDEEDILDCENIVRLVAVFLVGLFLSCGKILVTSWMAIFMAEMIEPPVEDAYWIATQASLIGLIVATPIFGHISDKFGIMITMIFGLVLFATIPPAVIYQLCAVGGANKSLAFSGMLAINISLACFSAPVFAWMVGLFPRSIRLVSLTVVFNVSTIIGGFSSAIATYLALRYDITAPSYMFMSLGLLALIGILMAPVNTKDEREQQAVRT